MPRTTGNLATSLVLNHQMNTRTRFGREARLDFPAVITFGGVSRKRHALVSAQLPHGPPGADHDEQHQDLTCLA
jgi:hypothetical protein